MRWACNDMQLVYRSVVLDLKTNIDKISKICISINQLDIYSWQISQILDIIIIFIEENLIIRSV